MEKAKAERMPMLKRPPQQQSIVERTQKSNWPLKSSMLEKAQKNHATVPEKSS